jgi:hypothetical protein
MEKCPKKPLQITVYQTAANSGFTAVSKFYFLKLCVCLTLKNNFSKYLADKVHDQAY